MPLTLMDGESVQVFWAQSALEQLRAKEGIDGFLYVLFMDVMGNVYSAPYPGVQRKRKGLPWKRRTEWVPEPEDS